MKCSCAAPRKLSAARLSALMGISDKLAGENVDRYRNWSRPFTPDNARPAAFAFRGDVYRGLGIDDFTARDLDWAQKHLRILSGLYGVLLHAPSARTSAGPLSNR